MASQYFSFRGDRDPVRLPSGKSFFVAPGFRGEGVEWTSDHPRGLQAGEGPEVDAALADAVHANGASIRRVMEFRGPERPMVRLAADLRETAKYYSETHAEECAVTRVVHEDGTVSWHIGSRPPPGAMPHLFGLMSPLAAMHFDLPSMNTIRRMHVITFPRLPLVGEALFAAVITEMERERCPEPGLKLINLKGGDKRITRAPVGPPKAKEARILLLIHGTYSCTENAFSGLFESASFRKHLASRYDYVLAWDHATLTPEPDKNARELRRALTRWAARALKIDIVSHSRGGLVARALIEGKGSPLHIRRLVMVGTPNGGTPIAWDAVAIVTVFSNMAGAALSGHFNPMPLLLATLRLIANDPKSIVPGILAQATGNKFLKKLNRTLSRKTLRYDAAYNEYHPTTTLKLIIQQLVSQTLFFNQPNDLVVPNASVTQWGKGRAVRNMWSGARPNVFHCSYFADPELKKFLLKCLY